VSAGRGSTQPASAQPRWLEIVTAVQRDPEGAGLGACLCRECDLYLGADASSIALVMDHAYSLVAASSNLAVVLDEEQFMLGEGPSFDGARSDVPVGTGDLGSDRWARRWPGFLGFAQRAEVQGAFAFPVRVGEARIGVMTAYRRGGGELSTQAYTDGLILASVAATLLLRAQAGTEDGGLAQEFAQGVNDQANIQRAAGMVAEQLNLSVLTALVRIRATAYARGLPLNVIANQILSAELTIEP